MPAETSKRLPESERSGVEARINPSPLKHLVRLLARQTAHELIAGTEAATSETRPEALGSSDEKWGSSR
jgi:hypothetical protein